MSNNLIPTRIVNKNGVSTTVHKKPVTQKKTPSLPPPPALKELDLEALAPWFQRCADKPNSIYVTDVMVYIKKLPERTQRVIVETMKEDLDNDHSLRSTIISSVIQYNTTAQNVEDTIYAYTHARDWDIIAFDPDWHGHKYNVHSDLTHKLNALESYSDELTGFDYDDSKSIIDHDEKTRSQVMALFDLTDILGMEMNDAVDHNDYRTQLVNMELAQLIVDQPENYDDIQKVILDRQTLDVDLIKSIFEDHALPLNDGVL